MTEKNRAMLRQFEDDGRIDLLLAAGNDFLFPGQGQRYKGPGVLSKQIAAAAIRILGVRVTGHQFRHLVGYVYLRENPGTRR